MKAFHRDRPRFSLAAVAAADSSYVLSSCTYNIDIPPSIDFLMMTMMMMVLLDA